MPYTFSKVSPTPAWVTINSSGLATIDYSAAPANGFNGIARFRVTDGVSEAFQEFALQVLPRYAVALDYQETEAIRYRAIASAKNADQVLLEPINIKYRAIATAKISDQTAFGALFVRWRAIAAAKVSDNDPGSTPANAVTINGDPVTVNGDPVTVN